MKLQWEQDSLAGVIFQKSFPAGQWRSAWFPPVFVDARFGYREAQ